MALLLTVTRVLDLQVLRRVLTGICKDANLGVNIARKLHVTTAAYTIAAICRIPSTSTFITKHANIKMCPLRIPMPTNAKNDHKNNDR